MNPSIIPAPEGNEDDTEHMRDDDIEIDEDSDYFEDIEAYNISIGVDRYTAYIGHFPELNRYLNRRRRERAVVSKAEKNKYVPEEHYVYYATLVNRNVVKIGASKCPERRIERLGKQFEKIGKLTLRGYVMCREPGCQFRHPDNIRTTCMAEEIHFKRYEPMRVKLKQNKRLVSTEWFRNEGCLTELINLFTIMAEEEGVLEFEMEPL